MKPTTLEEALSMVPTHWMLTPDVDKWKDNDSFFYNEKWIFINDENENLIGYFVDECEPARRPIPQDVRESAAWWLLYNTLATINLSSFDQLYAQFIITKYGDDDLQLDVEPDSAINGMRSFNGESKAFAAIKALGGEQRIIKELSAGPDPLGRWILEGKP